MAHPSLLSLARRSPLLVFFIECHDKHHENLYSTTVLGFASYMASPVPLRLANSENYIGDIDLVNDSPNLAKIILSDMISDS